MVKRLKGVESRRHQEAEGYDDVVTYGALAAEGFLPGYDLETGAILATTMAPSRSDVMSDFTLARPPASALREHVPGNLIYANSHRYVVRQFHLEAQELFFSDRSDPILSTKSDNSSRQATSGMGRKSLCSRGSTPMWM
jgi:hypothetical protein